MKANYLVSTRAVLEGVAVHRMLDVASRDPLLARGLHVELTNRVESLSAGAHESQTVVVARDVQDVLRKLERAASR